MRGFHRLRAKLQDAVREQRYEIVRAFGKAGCLLATHDEVRDLKRWLEDGTLEWTARRGRVIVPGWEYNELALVQTARNYLDWSEGASIANEAFLQWTQLIVERVRSLMERDATR